MNRRGTIGQFEACNSDEGSIRFLDMGLTPPTYDTLHLGNSNNPWQIESTTLLNKITGGFQNTPRSCYTTKKLLEGSILIATRELDWNKLQSCSCCCARETHTRGDFKLGFRLRIVGLNLAVKALEKDPVLRRLYTA